MRILRNSRDFSEIFSTLIFHLKLCGNSANFTIFAPFGAFGGPSGPLFSVKLDGRCCIFQEITFLHDFVDFFSIFSRFGSLFPPFWSQKEPLGTSSALIFFSGKSSFFRLGSFFSGPFFEGPRARPDGRKLSKNTTKN